MRLGRHLHSVFPMRSKMHEVTMCKYYLRETFCRIQSVFHGLCCSNWFGEVLSQSVENRVVLCPTERERMSECAKERERERETFHSNTVVWTLSNLQKHAESNERPLLSPVEPRAEISRASLHHPHCSVFCHQPVARQLSRMMHCVVLSFSNESARQRCVHVRVCSLAREIIRR